MSDEAGSLAVGVNVDIQRTDGRMHSAVISGINAADHGVTVEWFEHGETKGKEIDFETIFTLNEHLRPVQGEPPAKRAMESRSVSVASLSTNIIARDVPTHPQVSNRSEKENSHRGIPKRDISSAKSRRSYAARQIPTREAKVVQEMPPPPPVEQSVAMTEPKKPNTRRKSNCLKEVEKIKQKRDERRAANVAIKEFTNQAYDTSHPHWGFLAMINEYQQTLEYRPLTTSEPLQDHQICVCVRKRPLSKKELSKREVDVITVPTKCSMIVHEPKTKVDLTKYLENQNFRFDYAFDDNVTNEIVYRYTAKPLVECIFDRGMATCFAYGQTGSGKTHTMGGDFSAKGQQDTTKGIYALAARDLFLLLNSKYKKMDLVASASFFEIYSGKVYDLLNDKAKLRVLEDGKQQVQVCGLKEETISKDENVLQLIAHGNGVRTSGQTAANQHSSRSHAVFQLILRKKTGKLHGKFSLIDLAGNERGADTMSSNRNTRMEGAEINKSLLALKECIRALGHKGSHLPFRASKLTLVLRDSFVGDKSRTCMIAMISPGLGCCEHTLNTLRYADRVKELGPGGGGEGNGETHDVVRMDSDVPMGCMSPQNSDLAMIKTTNEDELPEEFLNFHEAMNIMQELEEVVVDQHKSILDQEMKWYSDNQKLYKQTDDMDYDLEGYAKNLKALITSKLEALTSLNDKVDQLLNGMANEESVCQTIKHKKTGK